jgi:hypothetical protein
MKRITTTFATFALTAAIATTPSAFAVQDPAPRPMPDERPAPTEQYRQAATATGELTGVDPDEMTITLKGPDGKAWSFRYNEDTEVSGAQSGVAGLATHTGTVVTVHFESVGGERLATMIEVAE